MSRFQRKAEQVDAVQNLPGCWPALFDMLHSRGSRMESYAKAPDGSISIKTPNEVMKADVGDVIVKDAEGEILVCPRDLFPKLFAVIPAAEPAEREPDAAAH
jgi:hypothetical protein